MLVLVEGVDGTGKTTLVRELFERGFCCKRVFRNDNCEAAKFYKYAHQDGLVILDRSFISDLVYRMVDKLPMEDQDLEQIGKILNGNVLIIHCVNPYHYEDAMERGEDNVVDRELSNRIDNLYFTFMTMFAKFTNARIKQYNYHNCSVDDIIKTIKEVYYEQEKYTSSNVN